MLGHHCEWLRKVTYLQISPTNRSEIPEYSELEEALGSAAGRINGKYGEVSWTPIRYVNRVYSRSVLAGLYRTARVGLVTPLRDGMNLVAKEYVAAQDPDDPGVLILSRFAGAAIHFRHALLVNPYDAESWPVRSRKLLSCRSRKDAPATRRCLPTFANMTSSVGNENS